MNNKTILKDTHVALIAIALAVMVVFTGLGYNKCVAHYNNVSTELAEYKERYDPKLVTRNEPNLPFTLNYTIGDTNG